MNDKVGKLRPLMDRIKEKCPSYFVLLHDFSFEESMIKSFSPHSCKQFTKGKPIHFGVTKYGVLMQKPVFSYFDFYQVKKPHENLDIKTIFENTSAPLVMMIEEFPLKSLQYRFHADNLLTERNLTFNGLWSFGCRNNSIK